MKRLLTGTVVVPWVLSILVDGVSMGRFSLFTAMSATSVAVMWVAYRVFRAAPGGEVLLAVGLCVAASALAVISGSRTFSWAECWSLIVLAGMCAARSHRVQAFGLTGLVAAAAIAVPVTIGTADTAVFVFASATATVTAVAIGLLIRAHVLAVSAQEWRAVADRERDAMARDLHDVVVREMMGVVILARAASRLTKESTTRDALGRIEVSGARALEGVRPLVAETRSPNEAPDAGDETHSEITALTTS
ncbi:histidine kinase [Rhodococcus sp. NPDC058521]|uniref:histidine kinase n=1 Tax=Rhodococcus sp. NPDC058521 TaxID=3346536 RepID=UPI003652094C